MHEGEESNACGVGAKRPRPHPHTVKPVGLEEFQLKRVPAPFGTDGQKDSCIPVALEARANDGTRGYLRLWVGDQANRPSGKPVEIVLHQDLEAPVDRHLGQPRVARLLKALDQQRPVARRREHMSIEVRSLHALGVRQDDLPHTESRDLRPEAAHNLRSWHREKQVDSRPLRRCRFEPAMEVDDALPQCTHRPDTVGPVQQPHSNGLPRHNPKNTQKMSRPRARESHEAVVGNFARFKQNQIHKKGKQPRAILRKSI